MLAIAAIVALSWVSYRSVRSGLESEFADRLESVAVTGASQVSPADISDARQYGEESTGYLALQLLLEQLRATPGTVNASIFDSSRAVVYDARGQALQDQLTPLDTLVRPALIRALHGAATVSDSYRERGRPLRAGLAPVRTENGAVVAVLAIEAEPRYLDLLAQFRRTLSLTTGVLAFVLVGFVIVRIRQGRRAAELERQLSRAENLAAMGRLTATLAHEIKNPLAIIRGSAQRLGKLDPESERMSRFVIDEVDRLSATVARYLQFARVDTAPAGSGDALASLRATLALLEGEFKARQVTLERTGLAAGAADHDVGPDGETDAGLPVALDNESLKQIYLNLILNALEAMRDGGHLVVGAAERWGRIEVVIADDGPGIPPETLRQLGNPFLTTKAQGSGLGLFLTRRLVQSAGGTLDIRSEPGRGTTCIVRLPRRRG
ncbi:MAG TPA: ATP-binding protein [Candidatus Limnocylindria bacterium]|nr:ATP-binding protein [Candidatus Limnocylindria bacterium]